MKNTLSIIIAIIVALIAFKIISFFFFLAWSLTMFLLKAVIFAIIAIPVYFFAKSKLIK